MVVKIPRTHQVNMVPDFSRLLLSNVERIDAYIWSSKWFWGADASAGVINIITTDAKERGSHSGFNMEYGSLNSREFGAYGSI